MGVLTVLPFVHPVHSGSLSSDSQESQSQEQDEAFAHHDLVTF